MGSLFSYLEMSVHLLSPNDKGFHTGYLSHTTSIQNGVFKVRNLLNPFGIYFVSVRLMNHVLKNIVNSTVTGPSKVHFLLLSKSRKHFFVR